MSLAPIILKMATIIPTPSYNNFIDTIGTKPKSRVLSSPTLGNEGLTFIDAFGTKPKSRVLPSPTLGNEGLTFIDAFGTKPKEGINLGGESVFESGFITLPSYMTPPTLDLNPPTPTNNSEIDKLLLAAILGGGALGGVYGLMSNHKDEDGERPGLFRRVGRGLGYGALGAGLGGLGYLGYNALRNS